MDRAPRPGFRLGSDDPFSAPEDQRELARRLRGRYASPVTIWTAGHGENRRGLTVSSTMIAEGAPPEALGLLGSLSDLLEEIRINRSFVVHVLDAADSRLADVFAGVYPVDPFENVAAPESEWGPHLDLPRTWMGCRLSGETDVGYSCLVRGAIEMIELSDEVTPLIHYHGHYRSLLDDT